MCCSEVSPSRFGKGLFAECLQRADVVACEGVGATMRTWPTRFLDKRLDGLADKHGRVVLC